MIQFGETKQFKQCYGTPPMGQFALDSSENDVHWDHCREKFAAKFLESIKGFYFSHPPDKAEDIGNFIAKFETIAGVRNHSKFSKTTKEMILWIEPSRFWMNCQMKRSLYTLLLRCGFNYVTQSDNFDDALFGEYKESKYLKETRSATIRFMFGFTNFTGRIPNFGMTVISHGWHYEFHKLDNSEIRRRLVSPEGEEKIVSILGIDTLWA